jgi:hypothetical protein
MPIAVANARRFHQMKEIGLGERAPKPVEMRTLCQPQDALSEFNKVPS